MHTVTIDYLSGTLTEKFPTLEEALERYREANSAACFQPGNDTKRITVRTNGTTVKTFSYPTTREH